MKHGTIISGALAGVEAFKVQVTATVTDGLPSFVFVGALSEAAIRETRVRVQSAISNAGFVFPVGRVTVEIKALDRLSLPVDRKVDGTGLDLPVALAVLQATGQIPDVVETGALLTFGELGLNGDVRPVRGAILLATLRDGRAADRIARGFEGHLTHADVLCAFENGAEAARSARTRVVRTLREAATVLATGTGGDSYTAPTFTPKVDNTPDFRDVKGQGRAIRAAVIAAAGGHGLMLTGGPGSGKTMIARRIPGILPPLTEAEAREVTEVHSVAGLNIGAGLATSRPFRAPHHSTTAPGLCGGGSAVPRPGEVSLAHRGVLFLDETPEFSRMTLDVLREPLTTGTVVLSRAAGTVRFPSQALVVGSQNPCPCGHFSNGSNRCKCSADDRKRYLARSTIVTTLCDVRCEVAQISLAAIDDETPGTDSATLRAQVTAAREVQARRGMLNSQMASQEVQRELDAMPRATHALLNGYAVTVQDTARIVRVARTIADLAGLDVISDLCLSEALQLTK